MWAEVVGAGANVRTIEIGDQVLFSPEDRYEVEVRGDDYLILRERDIHAVAARASMWAARVFTSDPYDPDPYDGAMPTGTRIEPTGEQLAAVKYNADGLVPAIVQDVGHARRC